MSCAGHKSQVLVPRGLRLASLYDIRQIVRIIASGEFYEIPIFNGWYRSLENLECLLKCQDCKFKKK